MLALGTRRLILPSSTRHNARVAQRHCALPRRPQQLRFGTDGSPAATDAIRSACRVDSCQARTATSVSGNDISSFPATSIDRFASLASIPTSRMQEARPHCDPCRRCAPPSSRRAWRPWPASRRSGVEGRRAPRPDRPRPDRCTSPGSNPRAAGLETGTSSLEPRIEHHTRNLPTRVGQLRPERRSGRRSRTTTRRGPKPPPGSCRWGDAERATARRRSRVCR